MAVKQPIMADRESLNLRIQQGLRDHVADIAREVEGGDSPRELSATAENLIYVGMGIKCADQRSDDSILPTIEGPFGVLPRPWAEPSFDGDDVRLGTRVDSDIIDTLEAAFNKTKHTAAKQALRLGVILLEKDAITIRGPGGVRRPFANVDVTGELHGERAQAALTTLQAYPNE
ncbi:hypothetical protein [Salinibaculum rarum]|uniref:hypothetical protein n=1 Tax=Salinibaculum rarum TaxID=3058903 RepID=UPI00265D7382|nr:hypothetical protein [Salinibaculum sp. KK48]